MREKYPKLVLGNNGKPRKISRNSLIEDDVHFDKIILNYHNEKFPEI